jgi:FAD dependent oxidoreductase
MEREMPSTRETTGGLSCDIAIIGGGLGGCAAALAAARTGRQVILTTETTWIGGQLTSQMVPPDEHAWIEEFGSTESYRALRNGIRDYYRRHLPLTQAAAASTALNPGNGWVSRLCHDPRVSVAVLHELLAPYELSGKLIILYQGHPIAAWTDGDRISAVAIAGPDSGWNVVIEASFFIDATPLGDLIALANVEHVIGAESRAQTGEPHAAEAAEWRSQQAFTFCFAIDHLPGERHVIERPREYDFWRAYNPPGWPGPLFGWTTSRPETGKPLTRFLFEAADGLPMFSFRRILDRSNFAEGFAASDVTVVDWPQNDYRLGPLCGVGPAEKSRNLEAARQLSLSLLYWLQTEAPRPDGGAGYPGLRLRGDVAGGTHDGLAQEPYIRSARRIQAEFTILEQHIAYPLRPDGPEFFPDSVGVGCYRLDLHPTSSGDGYLELGCWPFQIPLGSLIPVRAENLLPGGKNLGTTHITNGALRVHPVEWVVGEAAGLLASFCLERKVAARWVARRPALRQEFQSFLVAQGVELSWPLPIRPCLAL